MKMQSMKMSKAQAKDAMPITAPDTLPEYPYGLRLSLDGPEMDKLGMKDMPKVGAKMTIVAEVEVVACHHSQYEGGEENRSCSLQITSMAVDAGKASASERLYGDKK